MVLENIFASSLHLKALFVMGLNSHFFACFFLSQRLNIFLNFKTGILLSLASLRFFIPK